MNRRADAVARLEDHLGYQFVDRALIERALTHASVGVAGRQPPNNERLEFLGDRVLGLLISESLCDREPGAREGDLNDRLKGLVNGQACANVARTIGLGEALRLPPGETRRGARDQDRILGDSCEALIAALYLELGLKGVRPIVLRLWAAMMEAPHDRAAIDPKTELQEWAAAQRRTPPAYRVIDRSGPAHQPLFVVEAKVEGEAPQTASAGSVRVAEKAAALALLRRARGET